MNFIKEQIDYVKKALDHIDFLTGNRRNSKTKQIIEELQQENARLKDKIEKATEYIEWQRDNPQYDNIWRSYECNELLKILKEN